MRFARFSCACINDKMACSLEDAETLCVLSVFSAVFSFSFGIERVRFPVFCSSLNSVSCVVELGVVDALDGL